MSIYEETDNLVTDCADRCAKLFNSRYVPSLYSVVGNPNCFDCTNLTGLLFSNTDKLALLREGVAYYEDDMDESETEDSIYKLIEECKNDLTAYDLDIINARTHLEDGENFNFEDRVYNELTYYGDWEELFEIANIYSNEGLVAAMAYKYDKTEYKDDLPFKPDNCLHVEYKSFGEGLRDYVDYCWGFFPHDWDENDTMSAVSRFLDYWRMDKLKKEDVRGNYG